MGVPFANMKRYRVSRLLESVAVVLVPIEVAGTELSSPDPSNEPNQLLVRSDVEADGLPAAIVAFDAALLRLIDAITIARLVAISSYGAPTLVEKPGEDPHAYFIWTKREKQKMTVNPFAYAAEGEIESVMAQLNSDEALADATRHFREALLTGTMLADAFHLLRATEALCGDYETEAKFLKADHEKLKTLLDGPTYNYFYVEGGEHKKGVRNDLMHGRWVDQTKLQLHCDNLRVQIQIKIRDLLEIADNTAQYPPRGLTRFSPRSMWLRSEKEMPSLAALVKMAEEDQIDYNSDPVLVRGEEFEQLRDIY